MKTQVRYSVKRSVTYKDSENTTVVKYLVFSILFLILSLGVGIPLFPKAVAFFSEFKREDPLGSESNTIISSDNYQLDLVPEFTNTRKLRVGGTAPQKKEVKIILNENEKITQSDDSGTFFFDFDLIKGENVIVFSGKTYKVVFDDTSPTLDITNPAGGSNFFGSSQKQVSIQGTTESTSQVTVNDRVAIVGSSGQFNISFTLNEGENNFTVVAMDQAGNVTEKSVTVSFSP